MGFSPSEPRDYHGRWTNGGRGGHAKNHADAVVNKKVLDVVRKNPQGFSVTPHGTVPKAGFMVSTHGNTQIVPATALKGAKGMNVLANFAKSRAAALSMPGAHIGGWKSGNKIYLDVSQRVATKAEARQEAQSDRGVGR